jgi:hypothetical protein
MTKNLYRHSCRHNFFCSWKFFEMYEVFGLRLLLYTSGYSEHELRLRVTWRGSSIFVTACILRILDYFFEKSSWWNATLQAEEKRVLCVCYAIHMPTLEDIRWGLFEILLNYGCYWFRKFASAGSATCDIRIWSTKFRKSLLLADQLKQRFEFGNWRLLHHINSCSCNTSLWCLYIFLPIPY